MTKPISYFNLIWKFLILETLKLITTSSETVSIVTLKKKYQ
jgi:hypothetical protein